MSPIGPLAEESGQEQPLPGMAAEHALLGLLALSGNGSGHGYELARNFEADAPLGNVIRLEPGMIYHHLKKLERLGWARSHQDLATRPVRRPVAITDAGRHELARWLAEPVSHTREIRLEFLVKLYFALLLDPELAVQLVAQQRAMCERMIVALSDRLNDRDHGAIPRSREQRFGDMVLDMRLAQTRAAVAWLDHVGLDAADALSHQPSLGSRQTAPAVLAGGDQAIRS